MSCRSRGRLSYDTVFTTLSNRRRRYVLQYLQDNGGTSELRDIAEHLAAWENDKAVDAITRKERRRVYTALQQSHLPKMDDDGIVSFDRNRGTVEMTELAEELRVYLEVVQGSEIPWSEYYLGLSAVCVALVVAAYLGVLPGAVPDIGLAGAIALIFAFSAGINVYRQRQRRIQFANSRQAATDGDGGVDPETLADTDPEETEPDGAEGAGEGAATAGTVEE
jgi:hypothetical protein